MVPGIAIIERTTKLSICSHNLWTCGQCKQPEDNCIANRSFISWYNINSLKQIMGEIYVNFTEICMTILHVLHEKKIMWNELFYNQSRKCSNALFLRDGFL